MDIDEWMRGYALVSLCAVGDMYGFGNNHNFLMYIRPSDGKFLYFPTDMDFAFSRAATDVLVGNQNLAKVVNLPGNLRRLYAHMLDIINTSFNANYMTYWCAHYASFAPGQNYSGTGTSGPGNSLGAITARAPFVLSTINGAGGNTPFNVAVTNISTGNNLVAITGTAPVQVKTIEINGNEYPITWTTISAWRISVPVNEASNALNVVARDYSGNVISNSSRTITVAYTNAPPPDPRGVIVFNEIMFNPLSRTPPTSSCSTPHRTSPMISPAGRLTDSVSPSRPAASSPIANISSSLRMPPLTSRLTEREREHRRRNSPAIFRTMAKRSR
jgi:hypothetical protein